MSQDEDLKKGTQGNSPKFTADAIDDLPTPDPESSHVSPVHGIDMTGRVQEISRSDTPKKASARRSKEVLAKKKGAPQRGTTTPVLPGAFASSTSSQGTASRASRNEAEARRGTPGAQESTEHRSRELRKAQRNTNATQDNASSEGNKVGAHLSSSITTLAREERKAQRYGSSFDSMSTDSMNLRPPTSRQALEGATPNPVASINTSPNQEAMTRTAPNHATPGTGVGKNSFLELEAQAVDESYEEEVERLRKENNAIKAGQQQHQGDVELVMAEDTIDAPNYTRQIVFCAVCIMLVIAGSVTGSVIYQNSIDETCTDLPAKEILLSDVSNLHEEAFAWISNNDTWVPSTNCGAASNFFLERYALAVLYFDTKGQYWYTNEGWLEPVSVCEWQQIVCNDAQYVSEVDSVEKNFNGTVPSELGLLTSLTRINFDLNELTGSLPSEIGKWTAMEGFFFAKNQLTGPIPSEAGLMTSLTRLNLGKNIGLSGTLPTEIGMWTAATRLLLDNSNYVGPLPSELGQLTSLTRLEFFKNSLTGNLPSEIGLLSNMKRIELHDNFLSGTLPSIFAEMEQLEKIDFRNNSMIGSLPTDLLRVSTMTEFIIHNNEFTGSIPPLPYNMERCELAPLGETGNCFSSLANRQNCTVQGNCPVLDIEVLLADYAPLNERAVAWLRNDTWVPPLWVTDRKSYYLQRYVLATLFFETDGDNWFNEGNWMGPLSVCNWHRILCDEMGYVVFVDLVASNLRGSIPNDLGMLTTLTRLNLDNNHLTGSLPSEWGIGLNNVTGMFIYGNKLSGTIPTEWGMMTALTRLNLAQNGGLTGTLPTEIGMWTSCTRIMLFSNRLSGTIPSQLGALSLLAKLELDDNSFSGSLPDELQNLKSLTGLDARNNRLTGSIPLLPSNLTQCELASVGETGNCFCTDVRNAMGCNIDGNCRSNSTIGCNIGGNGTIGMNSTMGCDMSGDCTTGLNTTVGCDIRGNCAAGLNSTIECDIGVNCTTGMNSTIGCNMGSNCAPDLNSTLGCDIGGNCTTGLNSTIGCDIGVNCTIGMNSTLGCNMVGNCTTGLNTTAGCLCDGSE